jgi:uncharacterized protein with HEPN domain
MRHGVRHRRCLGTESRAWDFLVHQYDEIDAKRVEDVIERHLEPLAHAVRDLLAGRQNM